MSRRVRSAWLLAPIAFGFLLSAICFQGCGPGRQQTLVIGCKNFTEQVVLGEMLAQYLEAKTGLHVERRFFLAGAIPAALLALLMDLLLGLVERKLTYEH